MCVPHHLLLKLFYLPIYMYLQHVWMDALAHRPMTIPNPPLLPISAAPFPITISGDLSMFISSAAASTNTNNPQMPLARQEMGLAPLPPPPGYGSGPVPSSYHNPHYLPYFPVSPPPPRTHTHTHTQPFLSSSPFEYHPTCAHTPTTTR